MGVTSAWSPLGNFIEGQAHPNVLLILCFSRVITYGSRVFCITFNMGYCNTWNVHLNGHTGRKVKLRKYFTYLLVVLRWNRLIEATTVYIHNH